MKVTIVNTYSVLLFIYFIVLYRLLHILDSKQKQDLQKLLLTLLF